MMLAVPPATVIFGLLVLGSVWAVFGLYHLGICILAPALVARHRYATAVGLSGGRTHAGFRAGLWLGAALAAAQFAALRAGADLFFADARVVESLSAWGVGPDQAGPLLLVMLLLNGPAEELYWRGFVHGRLATMPRRRAIAQAAGAYASYHGATAGALFGSTALAVLVTVAVWGAGCLWGWLRERYGNVWPALLAHGGATAGYMLVYWDRYVRG